MDRPALALAAACALAGLVAAGILLAPEAEAPPSGRPNLVLVIVDTLRADFLGCYGHPLDPSPELDALARDGVRFERVVAQSTWTRPSIASLVTSRYPRTLGIYKERDQILPEGFVTLAERLDAAGYTTVGITANPHLNSYFGFHRGFDHYTDTQTVFGWMPEAEGQQRRGKGAWLPRAREVFDRAVEAARGPGPFYLQLNVMEVHEFWDPEVAYGAPYDDLYPDVEPGARRYLQAVRLISAEIDRFVRTLSARPGWRDTLFVITSDHGETLADHASVADPKSHGWLVYESQARVPLLLFHSGGGLPAGRVVEQPVRLLDVMPTLLERMGVGVPEDLVGRSLVPLLEEEPRPVELPGTFFVETRFRKAHKLAAYAHAPGYAYVENRDRHRGTNPVELQRIGEPEDGARTDRKGGHAELSRRLTSELAAWEASHPPARPTRPGEGASDALREQLRALGYGD